MSSDWRKSVLASLVCVVSWIGCGGGEQPGESVATPGDLTPRPGAVTTTRDVPPIPAPESSDQREPDKQDASPFPDVPSPGPAPGEVEDPPPRPREQRGPRSLADLMEQVPDSASEWIPDLPRMKVDEARAAAAGIHKVSGSRLVLYTDLAIDEEIKALPLVFEQAFPQWCEYLGAVASEHADWRMTGFLMQDRSLFERLGLLPEELPPFQHGFARNYDFWLDEQPSVYYRRHLVLHEGTHGFMNTVLGCCGPPWYMEGSAELLATHRWEDGRLSMRDMPADRDEVPMWGRIKIVKEDFAAHRARNIAGVLSYTFGDYRNTEPYAWCWAAAAFFDRHPRYQDRFREMPEWVLDPHFNDRFIKMIGDDQRDLSEEWQVFISSLEYGHDVARQAIDFAPGSPLGADGAETTVDAARGWQSSGVHLDAGRSYRIRAAGRYQVAREPQIWWCEPGGVSIRYYQGRRLGVLLGAIRSDTPPDDGITGLIRPAELGLEATLTPEQSGTLYLRINDSAAELADNAGELTVRIAAEPRSP